MSVVNDLNSPERRDAINRDLQRQLDSNRESTIAELAMQLMVAMYGKAEGEGENRWPPEVHAKAITDVAFRSAEVFIAECDRRHRKITGK